MKPGLKELFWSYAIGILGLTILVFLKGNLPEADAAIPEISMAPQPSSIRVRIANDLKEIVVRGRHLQFQKRPYAMVPSNLSGEESVRIARTLVAGKNVWVIQHNNRVSLVNAPALFVTGDNIVADGVPTPNELVLWPKISSEAIDLLAVVDIEKYLEGVLPSEMSPSWPLEALKAQAIAARTYAFFKRDSREQNPYDVEASTNDQVYRPRLKGISKVHLKKVSEAVHSTEGQILQDSKNQIFPSYYHSDCGGATDSARVVWKMPELGVGVKDSFCQLRQGAFWKFKQSQKVFMRRIEKQLAQNQKVLPEGAESLEKIEVLERSRNGRVLNLKLIFNNSTELVVGGEELRRYFGFNKLKSTRFDFHITADQIEIEGRGFGHGVGMCQYGAKALADKGLIFSEILKHYYPGAQIKLRPNLLLNFQTADARH